MTHFPTLLTPTTLFSFYILLLPLSLCSHVFIKVCELALFEPRNLRLFWFLRPVLILRISVYFLLATSFPVSLALFLGFTLLHVLESTLFPLLELFFREGVSEGAWLRGDPEVLREKLDTG